MSQKERIEQVEEKLNKHIEIVEKRSEELANLKSEFNSHENISKSNSKKIDAFMHDHQEFRLKYERDAGVQNTKMEQIILEVRKNTDKMATIEGLIPMVGNHGDQIRALQQNDLSFSEAEQKRNERLAEFEQKVALQIESISNSAKTTRDSLQTYITEQKEKEAPIKGVVIDLIKMSLIAAATYWFTH